MKHMFHSDKPRQDTYGENEFQTLNVKTSSSMFFNEKSEFEPSILYKQQQQMCNTCT